MKRKTFNYMKLRHFLYLLLVAVLISCTPIRYNQPVERKYTVQLSNWVGSDRYVCDSVIWITEKHFKLKNKEESTYWIEVVVPDNVVIRVILNGN